MIQLIKCNAGAMVIGGFCTPFWGKTETIRYEHVVFPHKKARAK